MNNLNVSTDEFQAIVEGSQFDFRPSDFVGDVRRRSGVHFYNQMLNNNYPLPTNRRESTLWIPPNQSTNRRLSLPANKDQLQKKRQTNRGNKVIPHRYLKTPVEYTKFGSSGFNFAAFNKSGFTGLEDHLPNTYCNALLQILYFNYPLRNAINKHSCTSEFCLTCELGYLFHMMDHAAITPCQANNFLRALRNIREEEIAELIFSDHMEISRDDLLSISQNWLTAVLYQVHDEVSKDYTEADKSAITDLFGLFAHEIKRCSKCQNEVSANLRRSS